MVAKNNIQIYECSEKEVHSRRMSEDLCTQVVISQTIEWILGPKARNAKGIRRPHIIS